MVSTCPEEEEKNVNAAARKDKEETYNKDHQRGHIEDTEDE